jgi:hypothetical protein
MNKKICIARLRSGIRYNKPLEHIMDSFCELLKEFQKRHPEYEYHYYNFAFGGKGRLTRDPKEIEQSDIIIIPSEAEFVYHIPGRLHPGEVTRSNAKLAAIEPFFNGKKIINLRSDRRDDEELYKLTFPNVKFDYGEIDEINFPGNVHCLKYYYIKRNRRLFTVSNHDYDFCYWGSDKRKGIDGRPSGDERHEILNAIHKDGDISSFMIGGFNRFKRDQKWGSMESIIPTLENSISTLCFNWLSNTATTSRYIEAIACGMIPLVWKDYDCTGIFVHTDWQRVHSKEEALDKIKQLSYNNTTKFLEVKENFLSVLRPEIEYYWKFQRDLLWQLSN